MLKRARGEHSSVLIVKLFGMDLVSHTNIFGASKNQLFSGLSRNLILERYCCDSNAYFPRVTFSMMELAFAARRWSGTRRAGCVFG